MVYGFEVKGFGGFGTRVLGIRVKVLWFQALCLGRLFSVGSKFRSEECQDLVELQGAGDWSFGSMNQGFGLRAPGVGFGVWQPRAWRWI